MGGRGGEGGGGEIKGRIIKESAKMKWDKTKLYMISLSHCRQVLYGMFNG